MHVTVQLFIYQVIRAETLKISAFLFRLESVLESGPKFLLGFHLPGTLPNLHAVNFHSQFKNVPIVNSILERFGAYLCQVNHLSIVACKCSFLPHVSASLVQPNVVINFQAYFLAKG